MTPRRRNRMLGLALGERTALVAEVSSSGGRPAVERVGEFAYPTGAGLAQPEALGAALGGFLAERGFASRHVVIGIPGKWILTKRVDAPPAEPSLVAESLRLQAEGEFAGDGGGEFVFDYAGESSASETRPVMLVAAPRRQVEQVAALAASARLRPAGVVPYAATLGGAAARISGDARVLLFGPGGAEFVAQRNGCPGVMRYLGPASAPAAFLAGELRRAAAAADGAAGQGSSAAQVFGAAAPASGNGSAQGAGGGGAAGEVLVWNDAGLDPALLQAFGETLGAPLKLGDSRALGAAAPDGIDAPAGYAAAVSLALAGLTLPHVRGGETAAASHVLPVDFLHSRLAAPRQVRVSRRTLAIAAACITAAALVVGAWVDLRSERVAAETLWAELKAGEEGVKDAEASVARTAFAKPWHASDPVFVACLHDITAAIPEDGQTFLTRFNLNEELRGEFSGKSSNGDHVFALLDRLRASGRFADVKQTLFDTPRTVTGAPSRAGQPRQAPPQASPQPPGQGAPPGAMPPGVAPPGAMPPMELPPGALPPGAVPGQGAAPGAAGPSGAPPVAEVAVAMVSSGSTELSGQVVPRGMPPGAGVPPASGRQVSPGGPAPAPGATPPPAGTGAGAGSPPGKGGGEGEVTFTMTFNYVPRE